jgi:hypothetical protein
MALGSLLLTGEERGRLARTHGERRHESIRQGNVDTRTARGREVSEAAADSVKACIGRERLPSVRRHDGHGKPRHAHSIIIPVRGYCRIKVYARPVLRTR